MLLSGRSSVVNADAGSLKSRRAKRASAIVTGVTGSERMHAATTAIPVLGQGDAGEGMPADWQANLQVKMQTQMQYQLMSMGGAWAGMSPQALDTVELDTEEDLNRNRFLQASFLCYLEGRDDEIEKREQEPGFNTSTRLRHSDEMFEDFLKHNYLRCSSLKSVAGLVELMRENKQRQMEAEVEVGVFQETADALHHAEGDYDNDEHSDDDDLVLAGSSQGPDSFNAVNSDGLESLRSSAARRSSGL